MVFNPLKDGLIPQGLDVKGIKTTATTCAARPTTRAISATGSRGRGTDDIELIDTEGGIFQFLCRLCRIAEGVSGADSGLADLIDSFCTVCIVTEVRFLNFDSEEGCNPAHGICENFHKGLQDGHDTH